MTEIIDVIIMFFKLFEERISVGYKKNKDQLYKHFKDEFLRRIINKLINEKNNIEAQKNTNNKMIKEMKKHNVEATAYEQENDKLDGKKQELDKNINKLSAERI